MNWRDDFRAWMDLRNEIRAVVLSANTSSRVKASPGDREDLEATKGQRPTCLSEEDSGHLERSLGSESRVAGWVPRRAEGAHYQP